MWDGLAGLFIIIKNGMKNIQLFSVPGSIVDIIDLFSGNLLKKKDQRVVLTENI